MKALNRSSVLLAVWLSLIAGYVDVLGFLHLNGYFVSFMSGNSTRLAVALQQGHDKAAVVLIGIIALFVAGSFLGTLIGKIPGKHRKAVIIGSVSLLLALSAAAAEFGLSSLAIALLVLAMGTENAIFQKDGDIRVGLTYMTGTLAKLGQKLAAHVLGKERNTWVPYLCLWLGLVSGGILGAVVYSFIALHGIWFAAAATGILAIVAAQEQFDIH